MSPPRRFAFFCYLLDNSITVWEEPRHWIAVASAEHVRLGRTQGFMQVCHGKAAPLRRMRAGIPELVIRTTFIVGFPGETEADFERTLEVAAAAEKGAPARAQPARARPAARSAAGPRWPHLPRGAAALCAAMEPVTPSTMFFAAFIFLSVWRLV